MRRKVLQTFKYLPVDEKAIDFGFYCTCYGSQYIPAGEVYPPRRHPPKYIFKFSEGRILPEYTLVFISDAKIDGILDTKAGRQKIPTDSFYLISPSTWHRYRPDIKSGWTELWIGFNGKTAHSYFNNQSNIESEKVYTPENFSDLFDSALEFTKILNQSERPTSGIIAANLFGLIAKIEAAIKPKKRNADKTEQISNLKDDIQKLIWSWAHTDIKVEDIARELGLSPRTLFRKVSEFKDFSIGREIDLCKLSRAKELLATTDIPIKAVANLAGYKNIYGMRLAFLRETNLTPKEFRDRFAGYF